MIHVTCPLLLIVFFIFFHDALSQSEPSTIGYSCTNTANETATNSCQTYAFYRATSPDYLDLASVADLFSLSRLMIANPSNISSPTSPLLPDQSLFVPIRCSCNTVNTSITISYSPINYTIRSGDTFYLVSTNRYQNLTTFQSVEVVNPTFVPTRLEVGDNIVFPIFCRCPNSSQLGNGVNFLISYVFQPSDSLSSIATRFGSTEQSITQVNGNSIQAFDTVFVPVSRLPNITQPVVQPVRPVREHRTGVVVGLGVALGICGALLVLVCGVVWFRERLWKGKMGKMRDVEEEKVGRGGKVGDLLNTYLDTKAIKVIEGGVSVGEQLLQQKWDKIFFTGSVPVARIVMTAAAKNLTPVTMELGGKCPAVVDSLSSSWDKKIAMRRILSSKFGACAGQACIAIDYILVEKKFSSTLVELLKDGIGSMFGEDPKGSGNITRIINKHHFSRLRNLLHEVKDSVVYGGTMDEENLFVGPTILVDPPLDSGIMTEEVFGPLLPIISMERIEDCIDFIKSKPKPLAVYVFTNNDGLKDKMESEISAGSIVFNDAIIQYAADSLPFGGVGECGFGRYHGKFSFDEFSHEKVIARRGFLVDFWFRYPPWSDHKLQLFKSIYRFDYLGVLLILLGLKKKY